MQRRSVTTYVAPILLAIGITLAAANWYVTPTRAAAWAAATVVLIASSIAWIGASRTRRRPDLAPAQRHAADAMESAVVFAGLIMGISLAARLAGALGALDDSDVAQRATMVVVGGFFVAVGNALPKVLTPLATLDCDAARAQALQRFMGWTWVLTGLAFSLAWLTLPVAIANPVSKLVMIGGLVITVMRIFGKRWTRAREA